MPTEDLLRLLPAACALLVGLGLPAAAQDRPAVEIKPLTGEFYLAPAADAADGAPADNFNITLTGDAAKAMWDAMKSKVQPDECVGRMAKWAKSLVCYGAPTNNGADNGAPPDSPYECYFGIDLKAGALSRGEDC
jgi:hypothetical protein